MSSLLFSLLLLHSTYCQRVEVNSPHTINWINSGVSLPRPLQNAIITYYDPYFIAFAGDATNPFYPTSFTTNEKIYIGYTYYTPAPISVTTPNPASAPYTINPPTTAPSRDPTSGGTTAYPTAAPTASYGFKSIISWTSNHTLKENTATNWNLDTFTCRSQCYSTNSQGTFFMVNDNYCSKDIFLYRFDPWSLINNDKVHFDRYNLTRYFFNQTMYLQNKCKYISNIRDSSPCVATDPDNFDDTRTVYIVLGDKVLAYNTSADSGYVSNNYFTKYDHYCPDIMYDDEGNEYWGNCRWTTLRYYTRKSACLIDKTGKYIWIVGTEEYDNKAKLWRYSIEDNEIFNVGNYYYNISTGKGNVNGTLLKTLENTGDCGGCEDCCRDELKPYFFDNTESQNGKLVELSNGFILLTGTERDFIFLPNLEESVDAGQYPASKTKYIDVACAGRRHDSIWDWQHGSSPLYMGQYAPTKNVFSFGGTIYGNFRYETVLNCKGCGAGETDEFGTELRHDSNFTDEIRYYAWLNDFKLVVNFTEKILFGDNIVFNIYFEPSCDLSGYNNMVEWTATQHNPIFIEIHITTNELSLGIDRYMYIINATGIIDDPRDYNWDRTYQACFICLEEMDLFEENWNDEEGILASDDGCVLCSTGLETGKLSEQQAGVQYQLKFELLQSPNDTTITLDSELHNLTITECEPGSGTTRGAATVDCNECPFNQFSLQESLVPCIACTNVDDGLACQGGNQTELTYNFWVAAWDFKEQDLKPFYEIQEYEDKTQDNDAIVTALCPPKYCCQDVSGCDYLAEYLKKPQRYTRYDGRGDYDDNGTWHWEYGYHDQNGTWRQYEDTDWYRQVTLWNITYGNNEWGQYDDYADIRANGLLCAFGRDVDVPLCGACLEGWAELLGTTQCGDCEYSDGWTFIVFNAFFLTMFLSWYIIFCDSKPIDYSATITKKQLMIQDDSIGFQTLLFKPCLYYFQSLNPIIDTRGITLWLSPVLAFFNFSFDTVGGQANKICWSSGLNACGEILINLLLPLLLMFNLFVPRCCVNKKGYGSCPCCCCCKKKKICCCCCSNYQEPYFYSAFFRVLLIVIGVVLTVCFKYVTYVEVQEKKLMFYSADKEAFGGWWFAGFFGILFVLVSFGYIFYKIKKQKPNDRFSTHSPYRKFVKSFKSDFWYWEFVLFGRRFFVSFFTSVQFVGQDYTNFIFLVVLVTFFGLQIHYKPFAYRRVNKIETLNLVLLISAFAAANFVRLNDEDVFVGWILSICILIPLIIIALYFLKIIAHRMQWISYQQDDEKIDNKVEKMLKRMPKSYRDMTKEMGLGNSDELEDYAGDKTITVNENKQSDDEHPDIDVANVSPNNMQKVQMVPINNDSTEFNLKTAETAETGGNEGPGYNNSLQEKDTLHSTSQYMNQVINPEMQSQEEKIDDDAENILENELDVVMSQETENMGDGNEVNKANEPVPPMYNPNARPAKEDGNDEYTHM